MQTTRNMVYYNGVWLDIVKIKRCLFVPQYSGQNYIHTKVQLDIKGVVSSDASFQYARSKYAAGSEAYPYTITQGVYGGNVNKATLSDVRVVGDARNGNAVLVNSALSVTPVVSFEAVKHHLLQPRGILLYYLNDNLVLACPQYPYTALATDSAYYRSLDAKNGPIPQYANIDQLAPGSIAVDFSIVCYINEQQALQNAWPYKYISSHSYYVDVDVDFSSMETRTTVGIVNFRADALKSNEVNPDDFREFFAPPLPVGFKRESFGVKVSPDHTALQYRCVDREIHYAIDRTTTSSSAWVKGPGTFSDFGGTIDRSKISRITIAQTSNRNLKGGDAVAQTLSSALVGLAGGAGLKGAAKSVALNLWQMPDNEETLTIEVFGTGKASTYELERVAFYVMLVRLPYQVMGCVGYSWKLSADKTGAYVSLVVSKTSAAQWGLPNISIYPINDDIKADCSIYKPFEFLANLGAGNTWWSTIPILGNAFTNVGYYPTNYITTVGNEKIISSFTGPEHTKHILVSSAIDTFRKAGDDPFAPGNFSNTYNRIVDTPFQNGITSSVYQRGGTVTAGVTSYINEINNNYTAQIPLYFADCQRSKGTAATAAIVHTSALMDIATPIGDGTSTDSYAIKRVNTDYRYKNGAAALNSYASVQLRSFLDASGYTQNYLNTPVTTASFPVLPAAPYSYNYQVGA